MCFWSDRTDIIGTQNISKRDFSISRKAIKDMPFSRLKQDLQCFSGMIAYLSKFIPQLSKQTHQLRELVKKDSIWDFTVTHRNQFDQVRSMVSENISLKFLDPKLSTKITCHSSKFGISATPEQKQIGIP